MKYATTVGELIAALQTFRPDQSVIGEECRAKLVIVEQNAGSVLIAQARAEDGSPTLAKARQNAA